ncbi:Acg family FMN-binding oxidoreductase [Mycobacterium sp. NPDC003323]
MSAHYPESETLRTALSLATRAPSVHNSQPWRWKVAPHSVHLFADSSLKLRHTDPDGRDMVVSCGIALNHCVVALAALGWQTKVHRSPNPVEPDHLASIEFHPSPPSEADVALAAAIPLRRTDRRTFSSWTVPAGDIMMMGARAARLGVTMRRVEVDDRFRALLTESSRRHLQDAGYRDELATWSGRHAATAGVPARNVPSPDPMAPVPGRVFAGTALSQPPGTDAATDHGVVLAVGTAADDVVSRLRAGEAMSQIVLTAASAGLASCIFTEPLEIVETRDALQMSVFGLSHFPQALVRVGWAPVNADPLPATPRQMLRDVASRLDGSPLAGG